MTSEVQLAILAATVTGVGGIVAAIRYALRSVWGWGKPLVEKAIDSHFSLVEKLSDTQTAQCEMLRVQHEDSKMLAENLTLHIETNAAIADTVKAIHDQQRHDSERLDHIAKLSDHIIGALTSEDQR